MKSLNAVTLVESQLQTRGKQVALWTQDLSFTFAELRSAAAGAQKLAADFRLTSGDSVLLFEKPSPQLYALIIGLCALGVQCLFVEPWMPLKQINHLIQVTKPKVFFAGILGKTLGLFVPALREVSHWSSSAQVKFSTQSLVVEGLSTDHPALVAFTSGTTGSPKGVVRTHGFLIQQHLILEKNLFPDQSTKPDLCLFANFALVNLASGRTSLLIPANWHKSFLQSLSSLSTDLQPSSLTCGPAFLEHLLSLEDSVPSLDSFHVGGALTDCLLFEKAFARWPCAKWLHVYGSSEAEPVAVSDAQFAVKNSRQNGFFQTLFLGQAISDIKLQQEEDSLWVTGAHVAPFYLHNDEENLKNKKKDSQNMIWHNMGDRIEVTSQGLWYKGRSQQNENDFVLEQKIYSHLGHSQAFVLQDKNKELFLCGQDVERDQYFLKEVFPEIAHYQNLQILRDRRHRARIDRNASLKKGAPWFNG